MARFISICLIAGLLFGSVPLPFATARADEFNLTTMPVNSWVKLHVSPEPSYTYSQPVYVPSRGQILHWGAVRWGDYGPDMRNDVRAFDVARGDWTSDYPRAEKLPSLLVRYGKGVYYAGSAEMLEVGTPTPSMTVNAVCYDSRRDQVIYTLNGVMAAYDPAKRTWRDMQASTTLYDKSIPGGPPVYGAATCYDPINDEIVMFPHWGGNNVDLRDVYGRVSAHYGTFVYSFGTNRWRREQFARQDDKDYQSLLSLLHDLSLTMDEASQARGAKEKHFWLRTLAPLMQDERDLRLRPDRYKYRLKIKTHIIRMQRFENVNDYTNVIAEGAEAMRAIELTLDEALAVEPPPRCAAPMVYHPKLKSIVMFGGHNGLVRTDLAAPEGNKPRPGALNDTWLYDCRSRRWRELKTTRQPPPQNQPKLFYDPASEKMLLVTRSRRFSKRENQRVTIWALDIDVEKVEGSWTKIHEAPWPYDIRGDWFDVCLDEKHGLLLLAENQREGKTTTHHAWALRLDAAKLDRQTAESAPPWNPPLPIQPQSIPPDGPVWLAKLDALPPNTWVYARPPREPNSRDWGNACCDPVRGHVYYFGGGHSTYQVNDVAIYSVGANQWSHAVGDHNDWVPPVGWGGVTMGFRGGPHAHHQRNEYVAIDGRMYEQIGCFSMRWNRSEGLKTFAPHYTWFYDLDRGGVWRQQKIDKVEFQFGDAVPGAFGVPHIVDPRGFVLGFGGALEPYDGRTTPDVATFARYDIYHNALTVTKIPDPRPGFVYECRPFCYLTGKDQIFFYEFARQNGRQGTWLYDVTSNRFTKVDAANQPDGEPRTVLYLDKQNAVYAVIGDGQEWIFSLDQKQWSPLTTQRPERMRFARPYAQCVFVPKFGVLVNMGSSSGGTAIMRPVVGGADLK